MLEIALWIIGGIVAVPVLFIAYALIRYWGDDGSIGDDGRPDHKKLFR